MNDIRMNSSNDAEETSLKKVNYSSKLKEKSSASANYRNKFSGKKTASMETDKKIRRYGKKKSYNINSAHLINEAYTNIYDDNEADTSEQSVNASLNMAEKAAEETVSEARKKAIKKRYYYDNFGRKREKKAYEYGERIGENIFDRISKFMSEPETWIGEKVRDNFLPICMIISVFIIIIVISGSLTSCMGMLGGLGNTTAVTTITADEKDIIDTEQKYLSSEDTLRHDISEIETNFPDKDEYVYDVDEIKHNNLELAALLTVLYDNYSYNAVKDKLQEIFDYQYKVELTEAKEIRKRTVEKTRTVTKYREEEKTGYRVEGGRYMPYKYIVKVPYQETETYTEEEEYEYLKMHVKVENNGIKEAAEQLLDTEQMYIYEIIISTHGNRYEIF